MDIPLAKPFDVMAEIDFWSYADSVGQDVNDIPPLRPSVVQRQEKLEKNKVARSIQRQSLQDSVLD